MSNARLQAVLILVKSLQSKQSLSSVIEHKINNLELSEQAFCKDLCFGVMREYFVLDKILQKFVDKPLRNKDTDVKLLIFIGFYQLKWMRVPDHAAINETVAQCKKIKKAWARGLVNAILRKVQKSKDISFDLVESHPVWLRKSYQKNWPDDWQEIIKLNQQKPPMILRVNLSKISTDEYLKLLTKQNIKAQNIPKISSALMLENPVPVFSLPGFAEGLVSVQDASAQYAAILLAPEKNHKILDACAAPGGKSSHILEFQPQINLTCVDNKKTRLDKIRQNLDRIEKTAALVVGDATTDIWWDGKLFDRILLDVPCSATGVIRRNPDVKVLRNKDDVQELCKTQKKILNNCWQMLKPGGILLYATCSLLPEENELQIEDFLDLHADAKEIPIDTVRFRKFGIQILSVDNDWDSFYYAKITKLKT